MKFNIPTWYLKKWLFLEIVIPMGVLTEKYLVIPWQNMEATWNIQKEREQKALSIT